VLRRPLLVAILLDAASVRAEPEPAYDLRLEVDLPALAIATAATTAWFLDLGPAWCAPECDPARVNPIDRPFAGRYSEGWSRAGTAVAALAMATPPVVMYAFEPSRHVVNDSVVIAEAMLFSSGFDAILQTAVRRPRPLLYGTTAPLAERTATNASLSFPSGHTALSFAAVIATWRTPRGASPPSARSECYPAGMRTRIAFLFVAVLAACSSKKAGVVDDGEARKLLLDRNWIDRMPQTERDRLHVYRFVPSMGGGVFQDRTLYKGTFELFRFSTERDEIHFDLPETHQDLVSKFRIESVDGPAPFDLKLTIEADPRGPRVYYGMRTETDRDGHLLEQRLHAN
jgi:hypothetical protein